MTPRAASVFVVGLLAVSAFAFADAHLGWTEFRPRLDFKGEGGSGPARSGTIEGETLTGGRFKNCEIVEGALTDADVEACVIRGATLSHAQVKESHSTGVTAEDTKFWGGQVFGSRLTRGIAGWVEVANSTLVSAHAKSSKVYYGSLESASAEASTFRGTRIVSSEITGGALAGADVASSTLRGAAIVGGSVRLASVFCDASSPCLIEDARVEGAHVENATLRGGSLKDVVLVNCRVDPSVLQENVVTRA